jgi:hypothetical protein
MNILAAVLWIGGEKRHNFSSFRLCSTNEKRKFQKCNKMAFKKEKSCVAE